MRRLLQNSIVNKGILLISLFLSSNLLFSQEISIGVKDKATEFYLSINENKSDIKNYYILEGTEKVKNYIINYVNGGYVIISEESGVYNILGFSETNEYQIEDSPLEKILSVNYTKTILTSNTLLKTQLSKKSTKVTSTVEPFCTDVWGSVNCYDENSNSIYVGNYYTPSHCSAGCVAISLSQVLYYYKWPKIGVGSNVYSDNFNGSLRRHSSHFDNIEFDWANMLDEYHRKASTDVQRQAMGQLLYSAGVALEMNYEPTGSTSNVNKTPFIYENFFRFTSHYEDDSWSSFWTRLRENIESEFPVPIAVEASRTGDGHVVVANGYKEINGKPYYYLNWGWYNSHGNNGWYNIQGWTSATGGYNTITGAAFDVLPNPQISEIKNTGSGNDFTVNWIVSDKISVDEYTLEQKADLGDWEEVAAGITSKSYTIVNPTGEVYQFRVKAKIAGTYYSKSWSETEAFAVEGGFDGYASFEGNQFAYAYQTPDYDLNFTGDYTFETWIRLQDNNINGNIILDQRYVFGIEIGDVTVNDYSIKFKSYSSGAELNSNNTGSKLQNGEWVHFAVSHEGSQTKLFINGTLRDENTGDNFNLASSNSALNIGEKYHGSYSSRIKAGLDQIRISSVSRYNSNFSPTKENQFDIDANTIAYFTFQNVHNIRFKDLAHKLSVRVKNEPNYVEWKFDETDQILAIDEYELMNKSLTIFPNPVLNSQLNISFSGELNPGEVEISLFDITGRKVNITTISNAFNSWSLDLINIDTGIYILQVKGDGFTASKKIIIH